MRNDRDVMVSFEPCEFMRKMIFKSVNTGSLSRRLCH